MATQGLISIVKDGQVLVKAVAGCYGYNAPELAQELRKGLLYPRAAEIYNFCILHDFGCHGCLVVMDNTGIVIAEDALDLDERYRNTFDDPRFNPRWELGTAEYTEIVDLSVTPPPLSAIPASSSESPTP